LYTTICADSQPTSQPFVFGSQGRVFGDVLEYGSQGVAAKLQPCILGTLEIVGRPACGIDPVQYPLR
jgi:hypothetical protein